MGTTSADRTATRVLSTAIVGVLGAGVIGALVLDTASQAPLPAAVASGPAPTGATALVPIVHVPGDPVAAWSPVIAPGLDAVAADAAGGASGVAPAAA
ncbi:MAG TPA: hypothetical protein VFP61_08925, partial [Acidimicrobiales bacterium]|nr:hypothetical protein [Acidimicrobiales bacterium]